MAIDTRDKRASAVHVALPWRGLLPLPDAAAENQGDRQQTALFYRGILASAPVVPEGVHLTIRRYRYLIHH